MTIHRIKSKVLAAKGEKFETSDAKRAASRLAEIKRTLDPDARLLHIPVQR